MCRLSVLVLHPFIVYPSSLLTYRILRTNLPSFTCRLFVFVLVFPAFICPLFVLVIPALTCHLSTLVLSPFYTCRLSLLTYRIPPTTLSSLHLCVGIVSLYVSFISVSIPLYLSFICVKLSDTPPTPSFPYFRPCC